MLVFTRKVDEAIVIGDGIEIRVLRVGRDSVRIGVTAPAHVPVHRREVYDQIRAANAAAATDSDAVTDLVARLRRARRASETDVMTRGCADWRELGADEAVPLVAAEARAWAAELDWDVTDGVARARAGAAAGTLPGFVASRPVRHGRRLDLLPRPPGDAAGRR